jgi:hypothetical protein
MVVRTGSVLPHSPEHAYFCRDQPELLEPTQCVFGIPGFGKPTIRDPVHRHTGVGELAARRRVAEEVAGVTTASGEVRDDEVASATSRCTSVVNPSKTVGYAAALSR